MRPSAAKITASLQSSGSTSTCMNNIAPAISPPAGIGDAKPANQAVLDWVQEVELLTQPENIFWCDGSERGKRIPARAKRASRTSLIKLNEQKVPRSLSASLQSERRRAGRAIHLHLHADERRSRPDQQLGGTGRNLRETARHAQGRDARAHDVRRSLHHGPAGFAADQSRLRNHRFDLRRPEHAHHDAHGRGRAASGSATIRTRNGIAACIRCSMSIPSAASSAISRRTTRSSRSAPVTAATFC